METIAARAKAARKFAKMTQKQAEAASGVKQSNISKIERGDTGRSMGLLALARAYRVDPNWLDTGDGPAPWDEVQQSRHARDRANEPPAPYRIARTPPAGPAFEPGTPGTVPLIAWTDIAAWNGASPVSVPVERWMPCIAYHSPGRTYALRVRGDSMTSSSGHLKSYPAGSIVFVDTQLTTPEDGDRIIARLDETGEITFKSFKNEDGRRWLLPLNPKHEPIRVAFTVLGTVVGKWEDED